MVAVESGLVPQWRLVGRSDELGTFESAWGQRRCRGVVIFGVAGVGKSKLAEECLIRAGRAGFRTVRATATAAAAAVPLGAVAHLIPDGIDLSDPVRGYSAIAEQLRGGQKRRWALWVDDLHLLDAASAVLIRQLMDTGVVRIIGTVRVSKSPASEAVSTLTGGDEVQRIDLGELDFEGVEQVLSKVLGGQASRRVTTKLYAASGGNLLYLRELVTGAFNSGNLIFEAGAWELADEWLVSTPKLHELIAARLSAAPSSARAVLELLAACQPLGLADTQQFVPLDVLSNLEAIGLVKAVQSSQRTEIMLAHPLYGEILQERTPFLRKRAFLLDHAKRIESYGARRRDDALHIASWRLAATGQADPALLIQAATLARHAHDYRQVVTLLEAVPEQHHTSSTRLLHAESLHHLGKWMEAEDIFVRAEPQKLTDEERVALTLAHTRNLFWGLARVQEALDVNEAARLSIGDKGLQDGLSVNEAAMRIFAGQPIQSLPLLENVEETSDEASRLMGMLFKQDALIAAGRSREAADLAERAYAENVAADSNLEFYHSVVQLTGVAVAHAALGNLEYAQQTANLGLREALSLDAPQNSAILALFLGYTQWLAGHVSEARQSFADSTALFRRINGAVFMPLVDSGLAASAAVLGEIPAAEAALADMANHPDLGYLPGQARLGEAWLLAARGQQAQARSILLEAAKVAKAAEDVTSESLLLTDVARLGGAHEVAARLAELANLSDGSLAPARAQFAAALVADDPEMLEAVAIELQRIGADLLAAEAAAAGAAAWRRSGKPRRATALTLQVQSAMDNCAGAKTPLLTGAEAAAVLTRREKEIAILAATGVTSKEIAGTLRLSVRTVDNHLQRAYNKLGVNTRRELANALSVSPTSTPPKT